MVYDIYSSHESYFYNKKGLILVRPFYDGLDYIFYTIVSSQLSHASV